MQEYSLCWSHHWSSLWRVLGWAEAKVCVTNGGLSPSGELPSTVCTWPEWMELASCHCGGPCMHHYLAITHLCLSFTSAPQHAAVGPWEASDANGSILYPFHYQLHGTSVCEALGWREEQATAWRQDWLDGWTIDWQAVQLYACGKGRGADDRMETLISVLKHINVSFRCHQVSSYISPLCVYSIA